MPADAFAVELGFALTGERLDLTDPAPEAFVAELAGCGWDAERLGALRHRRQRAEQVWPFEVDRDVVATVGFAVFHARLSRVRELLGLTGLRTSLRSPRAWDAAERRLAADRPPHWG